MKILRKLFAKKREQQLDQEVEKFPDTEIPSVEIVAFAYSIVLEMFFLLLKNGSVKYIINTEPEAILDWLSEHNIRDISEESVIKE